MKKLKIIPFFMLCVFVVSLLCQPFAFALEDPDIQAGASILVETNTGEVFYAKNEKQRMYPASTTKVMTVLLAVEAVEKERVGLQDMITVSDTAWGDITADSSTQNIVPGETMRFEEILYCALLASANEACNIIAETVSGGSVADFVVMMNAKAKELGCKDTHFTNTHGLPDENHYTTAWDMYLIAAEAMRHPLFTEICKTREFNTAATNKAESRHLVNTNKLISANKDSEYYYEYAVGMKTGSTNAAGYCLVAAAQKDGIDLISVVFKAETIQREDGTYLTQSFSETKRLFEWAFENYSFKEILSTTELLASVPVDMGEGTDDVLIRPERSVSALLPNDVDPADFERTISVNFDEGRTSIDAPVTQKDVLGEIVLARNGKTYARVNLVANTSVNRSKVAYMKNEIKAIFSSKWFKLTVAFVIFVIVAYVTFVIMYNVRRRKKREEAARQLRIREARERDEMK